jgi:hopanoid biosynthesis associated protein HpnK
LAILLYVIRITTKAGTSVSDCEIVVPPSSQQYLRNQSLRAAANFPALKACCYTHKVRRLIINADDFGLTSGVNRGILESHQKGVVTSSTLMACGARFDEAAALAAQAPKLSVGCHVVLVDGSPVLSGGQVSSLAIASSAPRFRESLISFAGLAAGGRLDQKQIEKEVTAQIQKLQAAGITVSHLDSHKHTHMFPVVLRGMLRAAENCGVRAIRNPFEPLVFAKVGNWKRQFQLRILQGYRGNFRNELARAGMVTPDGCIGIAVTGGLTLAAFQALVENLPEGTWEFVSHPGYTDVELGEIKTRLRASREKELAILTSDAAKETLRREQIELISYRDLAVA